jgi:3-oxoacyl-[acyl-carrier protein] reductase
MRIALITGAAGGIGGAIARRLAADGYGLALTDRNAPALEALAKNLASKGNSVATLAGDVRERAFAPRLAEFAAERLGGVDVLVGGAGASHLAAFPDISDEEWEELVDINLSAAFRVAREVSRRMIAQGRGGAIIEISSIAHRSGGGHPAYGAAKGGLVTLCYALAQRLGPEGITVNAVAPGVIDTEMVRANFPGEAFRRLERGARAHTPLRRLGTADDVAELVAFLASERARFITGAVIPVTGGIELLPPIGALAQSG